MPVGQMDRLVTIQKMTETRSATSKAPVETWSTLGDEFMACRPARGRERFIGDQISASGDTVWTMHYRSDMDPESVNVQKTRRLRFRGRTYDITAAVHVGMREEIELTTLASARVTS